MTKQHNTISTPLKSKTARLAIIGVLASVACLVQGAALAKDALKPAYTLSDAALYQAKPLAPEAVSAAEQSVQLTAAVQETPTQITLNWVVDANAQSYTIYRKLPTDTSWGAAIQTISAPAATAATSYVDSSVSVGTAYEYKVVKSGNKSPDGIYSGHGYVYSGINVSANDDRGHILILVDDFISSYIQVELDQLKLDLTGDGYQVLTANVPRKHVLEDWSKRDDVTTTKQIIIDTYTAYPTLKSIYF